MKTAICQLESISPYSQSRMHDVPKEPKEAADDYEMRTWRERCHVNDNGKVFIPPMAFKASLTEAALFLGQKIPGRRNATWTKHFLAGILVTDGPEMPITKEEIEGEWLFMNADGKRGSGTRVKRCYPVIRKWTAPVVYHILDDTITEDVFEEHLREAGNFIGIGRFRPRNGGSYGRYQVKNIQWKNGADSK